MILSTATTMVSTHSRPKAAGCSTKPVRKPNARFNTQPPEGGWDLHGVSTADMHHVSTHSRPKAAGAVMVYWVSQMSFQHTAARRRLDFIRALGGGGAEVSTHSRPKAAGLTRSWGISSKASFNTQPPEGGWRVSLQNLHTIRVFQHTAARRRLVDKLNRILVRCIVSTHSRPKAAG